MRVSVKMTISKKEYGKDERYGNEGNEGLQEKEKCYICGSFNSEDSILSADILILGN